MRWESTSRKDQSALGDLRTLLDDQEHSLIWDRFYSQSRFKPDYQNRNDPDGMTTFTLSLPSLLAGILISFLMTWIMTTRPKP